MYPWFIRALIGSLLLVSHNSNESHACATVFKSYTLDEITSTITAQTRPILEDALSLIRPEHLPHWTNAPLEVKVVRAEETAEGMHVYYYARRYAAGSPDGHTVNHGRVQWGGIPQVVEAKVYVDSQGRQSLVSAERVGQNRFRDDEGVRLGFGTDRYIRNQSIPVVLKEPVNITGYFLRWSATTELVAKFKDYHHRDQIDTSKIQIEIVGVHQYKSGSAVQLVVRGFRVSPETGQPISINGVTTPDGFPVAIYTEIKQNRENLSETFTREITWEKPRPDAFIIDQHLFAAAQNAMSELHLNRKSRAGLEIEIVGFRQDKKKNLVLALRLIDEKTADVANVEFVRKDSEYYMVTGQGEFHMHPNSKPISLETQRKEGK